MRCRVEGKKGHRVRLDVEPADGQKATYDLGRLAGGGAEDFSHAVPKLATDTRYRFRPATRPPGGSPSRRARRWRSPGSRSP